jgi:hypothetical protein
MTCRTELIPDARFCHGCGGPIGSMEVASTVGAEPLRMILAATVDRELGGTPVGSSRARSELRQ